MRLLFVTDLHGSKWKYDRVFEAAKEFHANVVINGGDMLPKNNELFKQGKFIADYLDLTLHDLILPGYIISAIRETMTSGYLINNLRYPLQKAG